MYIKNYIDGWEDEDQRKFINYQHQCNLSSPFEFSQTHLQRQPLSNMSLSSKSKLQILE